GPRLALPPERAEEPSRPHERLRVVQHAPVYVGEDDLASPHGGREPAKGRINRRRRQVIGDALPNEEGAAGRVEAPVPHELLQVTLIEVGGNVVYVWRSRGEHLPQAAAFLRQRVGVIDLEDMTSLDAGYPMSTAIEAGPQDDHLLNAVSQSGPE